VNIKITLITDSKIKKEALEEYSRVLNKLFKDVPKQRVTDFTSVIGEAYSKVNKTPSSDLSKMIKKVADFTKKIIDKAINDVNNIKPGDAEISLILEPTPCILITTNKNPMIPANSVAGAAAVFDTNKQPVKIMVGGTNYSLITSRLDVKQKMSKEVFYNYTIHEVSHMVRGTGYVKNIESYKSLKELSDMYVTEDIIVSKEIGADILVKGYNNILANPTEETKFSFIMGGIAVTPLKTKKDMKALVNLILKEKDTSLQLKIFKNLLQI